LPAGATGGAAARELAAGAASSVLVVGLVLVLTIFGL